MKMYSYYLLIHLIASYIVYMINKDKYILLLFSPIFFLAILFSDLLCLKILVEVSLFFLKVKLYS